MQKEREREGGRGRGRKRENGRVCETENVTSPMKRDHKGISGKPGKWVYITNSEFDLVQVKFIRVQTVKYENDPKDIFEK